MSDQQIKSKRRRLKKAIGKAAPQLAHALGGPLAGAAVAAISRALFGKENVDEQTIAETIELAAPEQVLALHEAELKFRIALRQSALEEARIDAGDRANARARHQAMEDWTPSVIGGLIIFGFFTVLGVMVARKLPAGAETEFSIMLGALATMTAAVVNYFFGSSTGSKEKTRLLSFGQEKGQLTHHE